MDSILTSKLFLAAEIRKLNYCHLYLQSHWNIRQPGNCWIVQDIKVDLPPRVAARKACGFISNVRSRQIGSVATCQLVVERWVWEVSPGEGTMVVCIGKTSSKSLHISIGDSIVDSGGSQQLRDQWFIVERWRELQVHNDWGVIRMVAYPFCLGSCGSLSSVVARMDSGQALKVFVKKLPSSNMLLTLNRGSTNYCPSHTAW